MVHSSKTLRASLPYDATIFASIPSLEDAHNSVQSNPYFAKFLSDFAAIVTQYSLNDLFGLNLVHRHASLSPGNRMLDLKQTLQPIPLSDDAQYLHGCPIRPKSYALSEGTWRPYEYELGGSKQLSDLEVAFFDDVKHQLEGLGLDNIGIRRYQPSDPEELEVTESGGISIKIPWASVSRLKPLKMKAVTDLANSLQTKSLSTKQLSGPSHPGRQRCIAAHAVTQGPPQIRTTTTLARASSQLRFFDSVDPLKQMEGMFSFSTDRVDERDADQSSVITYQLRTNYQRQRFHLAVSLPFCSERAGGSD